MSAAAEQFAWTVVGRKGRKKSGSAAGSRHAGRAAPSTQSLLTNGIAGASSHPHVSTATSALTPMDPADVQRLATMVLRARQELESTPLFQSLKTSLEAAFMTLPLQQETRSLTEEAGMEPPHSDASATPVHVPTETATPGIVPPDSMTVSDSTATPGVDAAALMCEEWTPFVCPDVVIPPYDMAANSSIPAPPGINAATVSMYEEFTPPTCQNVVVPPNSVAGSVGVGRPPGADAAAAALVCDEHMPSVCLDAAVPDNDTVLGNYNGAFPTASGVGRFIGFSGPVVPFNNGGGGAAAAVSNGHAVVYARNDNILVPNGSENFLTPMSNNNVLVPATNSNVVVPTSNDNVLVPTSNGSIAVPAGNGNVLVPTGNGQVVVPTSHGQVVVPASNGQVVVSVSNGSVVVSNDGDFLASSDNSDASVSSSVGTGVMPASSASSSCLQPGETECPAAIPPHALCCGGANNTCSPIPQSPIPLPDTQQSPASPAADSKLSAAQSALCETHSHSHSHSSRCRSPSHSQLPLCKSPPYSHSPHCKHLPNSHIPQTLFANSECDAARADLSTYGELSAFSSGQSAYEEVEGLEQNVVGGSRGQNLIGDLAARNVVGRLGEQQLIGDLGAQNLVADAGAKKLVGGLRAQYLVGELKVQNHVGDLRAQNVAALANKNPPQGLGVQNLAPVAGVAGHSTDQNLTKEIIAEQNYAEQNCSEQMCTAQIRVEEIRAEQIHAEPIAQAESVVRVETMSGVELPFVQSKSLEQSELGAQAESRAGAECLARDRFMPRVESMAPDNSVGRVESMATAESITGVEFTASFEAVARVESMTGCEPTAGAPFLATFESTARVESIATAESMVTAESVAGAESTAQVESMTDATPQFASMIQATAQVESMIEATAQAESMTESAARVESMTRGKSIAQSDYSTSQAIPVELTSKLSSEVGSIAGSKHSTAATELASEAVRLLDAVQEMRVLGLGSVSESRNARYQLALTLLLRDLLPNLKGPVMACDPVFSPLDCRVLEHFALQPVPWCAKQSCFSRPTLLYMPHCEASLCEAVLSANWSVHQLAQLAILGNSFATYQERWHAPAWISPGMERPVRMITLSSSAAVQEVPVQEHGFHLQSAFNDTSLHTFLLPDLLRERRAVGIPVHSSAPASVP